MLIKKISPLYFIYQFLQDIKSVGQKVELFNVIRHASGIRFNNLKLSSGTKDYRTATVLDDMHHSGFMSTTIKEPDKKKPIYQYKSSEIIFK